MKGLMATLSTWAAVVGVFFLASLFAQYPAKENLARWQEQGPPDMVSFIIMQVMAQPTLILLIGLVGAMVIVGVHLFNESRGWSRW